MGDFSKVTVWTGWGRVLTVTRGDGLDCTSFWITRIYLFITIYYANCILTQTLLYVNLKSRWVTEYKDQQARDYEMFIWSLVVFTGLDFRIKTVIADGKIVKLQLWDTSGQERFRSMTQAYYRGASGVLLVFDLSFENSMLSLTTWLGDIKNVSVWSSFYDHVNTCKNPWIPWHVAMSWNISTLLRNIWILLP